MLVVSGKTHFEEQALAEGTKRNRWTNKADRLADRAVSPARFVLCLPLTPLFVEVDVLQTNMS
jgi:hypothetical protein